MKTNSISFAEFRQFLHRLGYAEKRSGAAHVFHRDGANPLFFRHYRDQEEVDTGDLLSTRKFLDMWGLMEASGFDAFLERSTTTA